MKHQPIMETVSVDDTVPVLKHEPGRGPNEGRKEDPAQRERDQAAALRTSAGKSLESVRTAQGCASSDRLLDFGKPAMRFFEVFGPLYSEWTKRPFDIKQEILRPYDGLRNIQFGEFHSDVQRLSNASKAASESVSVVEGEFSRLRRTDWKGPAAGAANERALKFVEQVAARGRECGELAHCFREVTDKTEGNIRKLVETVLTLVDGLCVGKTPSEVKMMIDFALGQGAFVENKLNRTILDAGPTLELLLKIHPVGRVVASIAEPILPQSVMRARISPIPPMEVHDLLDERFGFQKWQAEAARWLNDHFVKVFEGKRNDFQKACENATNTIRETYGVLDRKMAATTRADSNN